MISPAARVKLPPERSVVPVDVMPVKPEATVPANTVSKLATVVSALTLVVDFRVAATSSTLSNVLSASVSMKVAICANLALFAASAASESVSLVFTSD